MNEPLTPPDCDLRDYPWMPVDCNRLLTSETWMLGTAAQKVAAFTLWAKSWHQVPAGSLPDNDRMLAILSEAGDAWKRVREHALRGWIKCSDGRLYHPVVCEKANESHQLRLAQRARTEAARAAKAAKRTTPPDGNKPSVTEIATDAVTESAVIHSHAGSDEANPHFSGKPAAKSGIFPTNEQLVTLSHVVTDHGQVIESEQNHMSVTDDVTGSTLPDQTRPDLKKEREDQNPSLKPREADTERAAPQAEAEPSWPPKPHPSAVTATVGVLTAKLEGRHRDTRLPGPAKPPRSVDEQLAALVPRGVKANHAPPSLLAEARERLRKGVG